MSPLRRRAPLPDDVRDRLGLESGDSVLGVAALADGWAVASHTGLAVLSADVVLKRTWTDVDGARLSSDPPVLTVTWVDGTKPTELRVTEAARAFARVVHDRVQSSVVLAERLTVPSGRPVRVVLRRSHDGSLFTQVIGAGDVDLGDPATAAVVDAAEVRVREAAGLA